MKENKLKKDRKKPRFYLFCYCFTEKEYSIHIKYGISINIQQRVIVLQTPVKPHRILVLNFNTLYQARMFEKYFKKMVNEFQGDGEWLVINNKNELNVISKIYDNFSSFCEDVDLCEYNVINLKSK